MKQEMILTSAEVELLKKTLADSSNIVTSIEKSEAEFRIHYRSNGGSGSCAIVYKLKLSIIQAIAAVKKLENIGKPVKLGNDFKNESWQSKKISLAN